MKNFNNDFLIKNEKGSITLFVLIAIMFFTIVLLNLYTNNINKLSAQDLEIKQICKNYEKSVDSIDSIYDKVYEKLI